MWRHAVLQHGCFFSNGDQYSFMQTSFYIIVCNGFSMNFSIHGSSTWLSRTRMVRVTALDIQVSMCNLTPCWGQHDISENALLESKIILWIFCLPISRQFSSTCTTWARSTSPCPRSQTTRSSSTTTATRSQSSMRGGCVSPSPPTTLCSSTSPRWAENTADLDLVFVMGRCVLWCMITANKLKSCKERIWYLGNITIWCSFFPVLPDF